MLDIKVTLVPDFQYCEIYHTRGRLKANTSPTHRVHKLISPVIRKMPQSHVFLRNLSISQLLPHIHQTTGHTAFTLPPYRRTALNRTRHNCTHSTCNFTPVQYTYQSPIPSVQMNVCVHTCILFFTPTLYIFIICTYTNSITWFFFSIIISGKL